MRMGNGFGNAGGAGRIMTNKAGRNQIVAADKTRIRLRNAGCAGKVAAQYAANASTINMIG